MNIIRETKWALLELFPEQKETEAAAEDAAWNKILADEAAAQAEAEAKEKEATEGKVDKPGKEPEKTEAALDQIEAAMSAIDLVEKVKTDSPAEETKVAPPKDYDPEIHDVPVSEVPEGSRPDGVYVLNYAARGVHLDIQCSPDQVVEAAEILDHAGFFIEAITGVDWIKEDQMEVDYDYSHSGGQLCRVVVRTRIPRAEPEIPTISNIFPGANWHERETYDFFGIRFQGHPNLIRILLPEDADFHPLLKDFTP